MMLSQILKILKQNLFLISLIALISLFSFQLGKISRTSSQPIQIEQGSITEILKRDSNLRITSESTNEDGGEGNDLKVDFRVVVSKNSTKYHFLWCPSVSRIKEENKIYFNSEEEAIAAGYTLAGNCTK